MARLFSKIRANFSSTSTISQAMEIHAMSEAEFAARGMKRVDVARSIMLNTAW